MKPRLLVTGANGIVGTGLRPYLEQAWELRLAVREEDPALEGCDVVAGDIAAPEVIARAVRGCDAILHLAAVHGTGIGFAETLDVNYAGLVALMDAAVGEGIGPVVFASSNHGWGMWPRRATPLADTAPPRPDGWYGVSKVFGEAVMALYGDLHGMTTTSLRIGNCGPAVEDERRRHMWISFRDLAQLVELSLRRAGPGHVALFATADCDTPFFRTETGAGLGFVTRDRPDDNLADPAILRQPPDPGIAGAAVGGGYAEANFRADRTRWENT